MFYLRHLAVKFLHLRSKHVSKFPKDFLMPGIVLETHLWLNLRIKEKKHSRHWACFTYEQENFWLRDGGCNSTCHTWAQYYAVNLTIYSQRHSMLVIFSMFLSSIHTVCAESVKHLNESSLCSCFFSVSRHLTNAGSSASESTPSFQILCAFPHQLVFLLPVLRNFLYLPNN